MKTPSDPASARRRELLKTLAAAGVSVAIAGCSTGDGEGDGGDPTPGSTDGGMAPSGPGDREFILGTTAAAQNLSPLSVGDEATNDRLDLLYDAGGAIDDDPIGFQGRWFEEWDLADDFRSVRYRLRDGLEWGAGYGQLTAEDYLYSIENVFTANWAGFSQRSFFALGGDPIEYEQTGELTFEASLPQPRANWLHEDPLLGSIPLPRALVEEYEPTAGGGTSDTPPRQQLDNDEAIRSGDLAGNLGPFRVASWEKGQKLVVSANEDYYLADTDVDGGAFRDSPTLEGATYQVFDELSTAYSALKAGDITATGIQEGKVSEFEDRDDVQLWMSEFGSGIFWINLNHRVNGWAPLRESREVRQALAHLFDKDTLIEQIFNGLATPAHTFHPTWGPYYDDGEITTFEPSVEAAREKFASGTSSDYGYDEQGTFRGPDGEQVELTMVIDNTTNQSEIVGSFLKQRLGAAGIALTIEGLPFGEIVPTYLQTSVTNNPNYDGEPDWGPITGFNGGPWDQAISAEPWDLIYGVGFSTGAYAPWQVVQGVLTTRGGFNFIGYTAEGYDLDATISAAATAESRSAATETLAGLFGFLSRDQPLVWSFTEYNIAGYRWPVRGLPEARNAFSSPNLRLLSHGE